MRRTFEPFWWALFGAGGMVAALVLPVHVLYGLAVALGWAEAPSYEGLLALVRHPLARLYLFGVIALSLLHAAHRLRFALYEGLQLKHLNQLIALLCYGGAIAGALLAAYTLVRV
ncbi:MAG TPA: fumarate reductase subunit FrdD [Roseiflexaceae bacterium]|nr:fumarate reductase subunit FrdD [Roseiflexaceae bacterium]